MSEIAIKKLEEQLKCSVCLDIYTEPKLLQCFHTYCRKCLVKLVVRDQQGDLSLPCPNCRQVTLVPTNGVTCLQSAFQIKEFLQIRDDLISTRYTEANLEGAEVNVTPPTPKTIHNCLEHNGREQELYCKTCEDLICLKCAIKGGKHEAHDYNEIKKAYERYKGEVTPLLEPMEGKLNTVREALAQLDSRREEISEQQAEIKDNIHDNIRLFHELLDVRKTELISQLHQVTQGKMKDLETQRDKMKTIQAQLSSCLDFVRKSLETESQGDVLIMKTNTLKQIKKLTTPFQQPEDILKPNTEADMRFLSSPDLITACRHYGKIYVSGDPDPSQCQATVRDLSIAVAGMKISAVVQVLDYSGKQCNHSVQSLECELVSEITGSRVIGNIEKRGQSQYEIGYQPTMKGKHQLHIKVEGQHIRGSPFSVAVTLPVEKLGNPILTIDRVERPWGVAVNQRGEVVVTETAGHCVSVFSQCGRKLRSFGTYGSGHGQFNELHGVAVDCEGNILVVDSANYRIQKFTATGKFLKAVGTKGTGPLQFFIPRGISFNATKTKMYVVDVNCLVQILNSDLTFYRSFGRKGSSNGQFKSPCDIACDSTGNVYITDSGNHNIQVFTADGKFLRMFGRPGQDREELNGPIGIAIDTNDIVYVIEFCNGRVSVFTCDGQFLTSFGRNGKDPGEFIYPVGLAVNNSGVVYVCDRGNNRIQCF